jgi:hypothetical protein
LLYHGYRITFAGYDQDGSAVFLITKRRCEEVLAKTTRACEAIDLINEWRKQIEIPFTKEVEKEVKNDSRKRFEVANGPERKTARG